MLELLCFVALVQLAIATVLVTSISGKLELNCSTTSDFVCDNNRCIPMDKRCDSFNDCVDLSDEMDCDIHLCREPYWFKCKNKKCISKSFVCDNENDCGDSSDEQHCSSWQVSTVETFHNCSENEWRCSDRLCIPTEWVCNGEVDCIDASDEHVGCEKHSVCDGFKCNDSQCIPKEWRCDKTTDCKDASDELNCDFAPEDCSLEKGFFRCISDNSCIQSSELCDGIAHCHDNSDESTCTSCGAFNCSHGCVTTPLGIHCLCPHGYYAKDSINCVDVDECKMYGICDQKCRNKQGSYECYCENKYTLQDDKRTCAVKDGEAIMIFSTKDEIRGYFLQSQLYFPIAKQLQLAIGVAFDGSHVYWTEILSERESIVRALEDGTHRQVLVTSGLGTPEDLSIDWVTGNIYFTDSEMQHIGVCTNEGLYCAVIINHAVEKPRSIVLDPENGEMYWSDWGNRPEIARANMDGSKDTSFVANEIYWPNGLALDIPNQRLYWGDAKSMTIESISLDGSGRRVILQGIVKHPYGLAVFENRIYWSDWSTRSIESCDKFTGRDHQILIKQAHEYIYDINIYHSALQPRRSNPCTFAFCSDICLLNGQSYTCTCPENKILDVDKHLCTVAVRSQQLIIGTTNTLLLMQYQQLGKINSPKVLTSTFQNISALAYNSVNHSVFISDSSSKTLIMLNIHTEQTDRLISVTDAEIVSMDFDVLGNNLYWCDANKNVVEVLNLNTMSRKVLINDMVEETPTSIVVVSNEGNKIADQTKNGYTFTSGEALSELLRIVDGDVARSLSYVFGYNFFAINNFFADRIMFVAFQRSKHSTHIDRLHMDGRDRTHVIEKGLLGPIHLLYDAELHRIFWADSGTGLIESTSMDGDDRHQFRAIESSPNGIASVYKNIFWINRQSNNVYWATKINGENNNKRIAVDIPGHAEIVHLISATPQEIHSHACQQNNGNCSHLCLVTVGTAACACPLGMKLENNNKTCIKPRFCGLNEFLCQQSNVCISNDMHCDQKKDCNFGEDEEDCGIHNGCSSSYFQCQNNDCIKKNLMCDRHYDCKDKSDEADCDIPDSNVPCSSEYSNCTIEECRRNPFLCEGRNITCNSNQFSCNSGLCIPKNWECDQEFDCHDLSDEHKDCGYAVCQSPKFQCNNGLCIDSLLKCNGVDECGDFSDETSCVSSSPKTICKANEFHCYRNDSLCVPISSRCNGTSECPQHEDEQACSNCHMDKFECNNGNCISRQWICDHVDDCGDNSDENMYMCLHEQKHLLLNSSCDKQFRCKNGHCVDMSQVCNSKDDCGDGSDEDGACVLSCSIDNNPCSHICLKTPTGPQCYCNSGYKLRGDGRTCTDVKECLLEPPVCSQTCNEVSGSFSCSCYDDYILRSDGTSCKSIKEAMSLIFAASNELYRLFYVNNTLTRLYSDTIPTITGLDVSVEKNLVYFTTESGNLHRIHLHHLTQKYLHDVGRPQHVAVEWISENIYFVNDDVASKSIRVCNFETRSCTDVLNFNYHYKISALTIDAVNQYIFYSQSSWKLFTTPSSVIYKCNLDGSNLQPLFSSNNEYITGLTYNIHKKILYYGDNYSGKIYKIHYDGTNQAEIITNLTRPTSLSVFEDHLYFYAANGRMTVCPLFKDYQACKSYRVYGRFSELFVIFHSSRQPSTVNVCDNHNCTYLCIPKNNAVQCTCNSDKMNSDLSLCHTKQVTSLFHLQIQHEREGKKGSSIEERNVITTIVIIATLFVIVICIAIYYYLHKKRSGNFSISMRFQNPVYGYLQESSQEIIIRPGQHEYYNPINSIGANEMQDAKKIVL